MTNPSEAHVVAVELVAGEAEEEAAADGETLLSHLLLRIFWRSLLPDLLRLRRPESGV